MVWYKERNRTCTNPEPKYGGTDCVPAGGVEIETIICDPVNGAWSAWSEYGSCDKLDPDENVWHKKRKRECNDPEPNYGGLTCDGVMDDGYGYETVECDPVDGTWTDWIIDDGNCNLNDDEKWVKPKTRQCNEPKYGGADCVIDPETGEGETGIYICDPGMIFFNILRTPGHHQILNICNQGIDGLKEKGTKFISRCYYFFLS